MKRFLFALFLALIAASPAAAVESGPVPGDTIAVLAVPLDEELGAHGELSGILARAVRRELERNRFTAVVLSRTVDEMVEDGIAEVVDADWVIEIVYSDARSRSWGGVATGGTIGDVAVGGEVGLVTTALRAEMRIYDRNLELVEELALRSRATLPAITGVGAGGRAVWAWVATPLLQRQHYRSAAGVIAREAVARLRGEAVADGR